jgi:rubrerythrin
MFDDLSHEIWSTAQLMPDEGIENAVQRIVLILESNFNTCFYCGTTTIQGEKGQECPMCGGRPA